jgi:DNA-binding Xre family transcriptional regulator
MRVREMSATDISEKMESGRNRATLYRILSGATQDPKVSTFVDICRALEVSPIEVLQLAQIVPYTPRDTDLLDIRLRQTFRHVQTLPEDLKRLAVAQIGAVAETIHEYRDGSGEPDGASATVESDGSEEQAPVPQESPAVQDSVG